MRSSQRLRSSLLRTQGTAALVVPELQGVGPTPKEVVLPTDIASAHNRVLRLDPPDQMVVVVCEPDRAVVEVNRVPAAAVPLRDDAVRACVNFRQWNAE